MSSTWTFAVENSEEGLRDYIDTLIEDFSADDVDAIVKAFHRHLSSKRLENVSRKEDLEHLAADFLTRNQSNFLKKIRNLKDLKPDFEKRTESGGYWKFTFEVNEDGNSTVEYLSFPYHDEENRFYIDG